MLHKKSVVATTLLDLEESLLAAASQPDAGTRRQLGQVFEPQQQPREHNAILIYFLNGSYGVGGVAGRKTELNGQGRVQWKRQPQRRGGQGQNAQPWQVVAKAGY